jgi:hypothetical protein
MEEPFTFYPKSFEPLKNPQYNLGIEQLMKSLMLGPNPVVVVGVVGKSNTGKTELLTSLLDLPVFEVCFIDAIV